MKPLHALDLAFLLTLLPTPASALTTEIIPIAVTGEPAPETEAGTVFETFGGVTIVFSGPVPPRIDLDGNVVFVAALDGPSILPFPEEGTNEVGIYVADGLETRLVARLGSAVPGSEGEVFVNFGNDFGVTAFPEVSEGLVGFQGNGRLWSETELGLVALDLDGPFEGVPPGLEVLPAPLDGTNGQLVFGEKEDDGTTLLQLISSGSASDLSQWMVRTTPEGPPTVILGTGFPAPELPEGTFIDTITGCVFGAPFIDSRFADRNSDFLLLASVFGPGVDCLNDEALYVVRDDVPELIAYEGTAAPGVPDFPGELSAVFGSGNGFNSFTAANFRMQFNDSGDFAFGAIVRDGIAQGRGEVIYTNRSGELEPLVIADSLCAGGGQPGDPVPGAPSGWTFSHVFGGDFNAASQVAFRAIVGNSNLPELAACLSSVTALVWDAPGELTTLAVQGQPVPGFPEGTTFADLDVPRLAPADVLFVGVNLEGPDIGFLNDRFLVAFELDGSMRVLLREGDLIDVYGDGSVVRQLQDFRIGDGMSAIGEVPVTLEFTDGSDALVVLRVPEGDLFADDDGFDTSAADSVDFDLRAGAALGGRNYLLLASLSGTTPGIDLTGTVTLPLNPDAATQVVISALGTPNFDGFLGSLDALGRGEATFAAGPLGASLAGLELSFAYFLFDPVDFASSPVSVQLTGTL